MQFKKPLQCLDWVKEVLELDPQTETMWNIIESKTLIRIKQAGKTGAERDKDTWKGI